MTRVHLNLRDPAADGELVPAVGEVIFQPTARRHVDGPEDLVVLPVEFSAVLDAGRATVDLAPSGSRWVWMVRERVPGGQVLRYVEVPDAADVDYGDLREVNPASLDPVAPPDDVWWAAFEELAARVRQIEDEGGAGGAGADGRTPQLRATSSAIEWKYTDDEDDAWTVLVPLADITGPPGPQGDPGPQGNPGATTIEGVEGLTQALAGKVEALGTLTGVWGGTQAQYDALEEKSSTVAYLIVGQA